MSSSDKQLASAARKLLSKEITYNEFLNMFPYEEVSENAQELISAIEHEPHCGGVFGMTKKEHDLYLQGMYVLIEELEKSNT